MNDFTPPALIDQLRAALVSCGFKPEVIASGSTVTVKAISNAYLVDMMIVRLPDPEQIADAIIDQSQGAEAYRVRQVEATP